MGRAVPSARIICLRCPSTFFTLPFTETVAKFPPKKDVPKIVVTMEPDAGSVSMPTEKATYRKIKKYVEKKHGLSVSNSYIAYIKSKCGIVAMDNCSPRKSRDAKEPKCPYEKESAIMDAFRHFGMI